MFPRHILYNVSYHAPIRQGFAFRLLNLDILCREIQCLPYPGFLESYYNVGNSGISYKRIFLNLCYINTSSISAYNLKAPEPL